MNLQEALAEAKKSTMVGARLTPDTKPIRTVIPAPVDVESFNKFKEAVLSNLENLIIEQLDAEQLCSQFIESDFKLVGIREGRANEILFDEIIKLSSNLKGNKS